MEPGSIFGSIGGSGGFRAREEYNSCYGGTVVGNASVNIWRAIDPAVVSMSATGYATATASYVGTGETQVEAEWTAFYTFNIGQAPEYPECASTEETVTRDAPVEVMPQITSITPERGLVGSIVDVTIEGSGFGSGATVSVGGTGVTANVMSASADSITAKFTIAVNAGGGSRPVTVTFNGATSSEDVTFSVQIPSKLRRFDFKPGAPDGYGPLTLTSSTNNEVRNVNGMAVRTNECGVYRNLVYELVDQDGEAVMQSFMLTETFSDHTGVGTTPGDITATSSGGLVQDLQYFGRAISLGCPGVNDNESFKQKFIVKIGQSNFPLSTVVSIVRGRFNGTYKLDVTTTTP